MLRIKYSELTPDIDNWKELLNEMVVTHLLEQNHSLKEPVLVEGNNQVKGISAINQYLEELKAEMSSWWYCGC